MVYFKCDKGTAPITKNRGHIIFTARGMTPITKNVIVVDEFGNEYEATYPKRAKGLVKCGRARFINENKICMLCPPNNELEDSNMSENKKVDVNIEAKAEMSTIPEVKPEKLTIDYVLEQIEKIQMQTDYITAAISTLGNTHAPTDTYDIAGSERNQALGEIVKRREATNQKLIAFYEKMYDDLKPPIPSERERLIAILVGQLENPKVPHTTQDGIIDILATALQDLSKNI